MDKEVEMSKLTIPFNSREYEDRISKLRKEEYKLFKMIILSEKVVDKSELDLKNLYKNLEVNSQEELIARYSANYYNEFSDDFDRSKEENGE